MAQTPSTIVDQRVHAWRLVEHHRAELELARNLAIDRGNEDPDTDLRVVTARGLLDSAEKVAAVLGGKPRPFGLDAPLADGITPMTSVDLVNALRAGIAALETGAIVQGVLDLTSFAGIHPAPGEPSRVLPVRMTLWISGKAS